MQENKTTPEGNVRPYKSVLDEHAALYSTDAPKTEKQKWNEMSRKERITYFRSYYALKTLAVIGIIAAIIFMVVHFVTTKDMAMGILAVNADGTDITASGPEYFDEFLEENGVNTRKNTVNLNYSMYIDATSEESIDETNLQTISTLFMTRSVDVFIADEEFYKAMANANYITDITDFLPADLLADYEDDIVYTKNQETGETFAAGIRLSTTDNQWLADTGWYEMPEVVVGLSDGMKDQKLATAMLEDILQQ